MMFRFGSFNLKNEFERASNETNTEQLASSSLVARLGYSPNGYNHLSFLTNEW